MKRTEGNFDPTDIFAALNRARVRYLVVGGVAAVLYGVHRTTWDVDVSVQLTVANLKRLEHAFRRLGFERRVPAPITGLADPQTRRHWIVHKGMRVYSYIERAMPQRTVDVMVEPLSNFDELYRRRTIKRSGHVVIPLVPVETLLAMKRRAARPQDMLDVQDLRRLGKA